MWDKGSVCLREGGQGRKVGTQMCQPAGVCDIWECEGIVRHRSRTCVRQLKASVARILWGVLPSLAFCPVRDALSQPASAASLGLDRKKKLEKGKKD